MQSKFGALLLLLVASLAVGRGQAKLDVTDDYLPRADPLPLDKSPFLQETLAMMVKHPLPAGSSDQMLAAIKGQLDNTKDLKEMDFFEELYDLSLDDCKCTPNLRRYVLAILTLARETSEPAVQTYVEYLKSSIPTNKFGQCARETGSEFARALDRYARRDEQALDQLFMAYGGTASGMQDAQLYRAAQTMDFARGDFDVRQALKVSKEIMPVGDRERERASRDQLVQFIHTWCLRMQEPLKNVMAVYNLARALNALPLPTAGELPVQFLKLNEYNRVCLTLQKNRAQAEANIERQLKATKWYKG